MIGLRVLLVHPIAEKAFFGSSACFMPLGLAYIAAVLEQTVETVTVIDQTVDRMTTAEFGALVSRERPDLVGLTVVTPTAKMAYKLAKAAKETWRPKVVMGGPHATALPEEALAGGADYVVRGEGESTIVELVQVLDPGVEGQPPDLRQIVGLSYRDAEGNTVHNPDRPFIRDLDALPFPARHLFPPLKIYEGQPLLGNRTPIANVLTSRGCPFDCVFCYKACFGRVFRARGVDSVISEWRELIHSYGVREIAIVDDAFATRASRVAEICDRLIGEGLVIPWSCPSGIRVDAASEKLLKKMKQAGCYRVAFGIESGNEKILASVGKHIRLSDVKAAIDAAKRAGLHTTAFFMLGNPGETRQTMEDTIRLAKHLNPDYAQFTIATPYPGTKLYTLASESGRILIQDWDDYSSYEGGAYYEMGELTADLLQEMSRRAYREFYLRPSFVIKKLATMNTYRYLGRSVRGAARFVFGKA